MFENLQVANQNEMLSLNDAHVLIQQIKDAGISSNPRLYANQSSGGPSSAQMVPETPDQDNSDIPMQSNVSSLNLQTNADGNNNPLPADLPVYLQIWIVEKGNFFNAGYTNRYVNTLGIMTLQQALS
jgi:hypothetical protein